MNIFTNPFKRRELYWKIRGWIFPQQKWLFKKIGNTWRDIDGIIEIVLFECLIRYVEVERGLDGSWSNAVEEKEEISKVYNYIKNERPLLQKELDTAYPVMIDDNMINSSYDPVKKVWVNKMKSCDEMYGMSYNEAYQKVNWIEGLIKEKDTDAMMKIIKHRDYLWT